MGKLRKPSLNLPCSMFLIRTLVEKVISTDFQSSSDKELCQVLSLCKNVMNAVRKHLLLEPIQRVQSLPIKEKLSKPFIPTATDLTLHNTNHTY